MKILPFEIMLKAFLDLTQEIQEYPIENSDEVQDHMFMIILNLTQVTQDDIFENPIDIQDLVQADTIMTSLSNLYDEDRIIIYIAMAIFIVIIVFVGVSLL